MSTASILVPYVVAAAAGCGVGAVLAGALSGGQRRLAAARMEEAEHRVRALEADLRVAQRVTAEAGAGRESLDSEHRRVCAELDKASDELRRRDERERELRVALQAECRKVTELRNELADRAEQMVRTHVQLRDTENELGVVRIGSDVVVDQINRLEHERDELGRVVAELRRELAQLEATGSRRAPPDCSLVDC